MGKTLPVHEVKFGKIRAAVWANEMESGIWHSVTFSRLYKDKEGKWQDSDSFSREDLPLLIKAADQVHTFLYQRASREEPEEA
jgi:hypothetical protein